MRPSILRRASVLREHRIILRFMSLFLLLTTPAFAEKPTFTVGWSIYAGWTPYHYLAKSGILKKWADKYGITIKVQRFDYAPSLDAFVSRNIDACTMTTWKRWTCPRRRAYPPPSVIIGDYSNGNDALLVRNGLQMKDLPGKKMLLVEKNRLGVPLRPRLNHEWFARPD